MAGHPPRLLRRLLTGAAGRLLQRLDGVGGGVKYEYDLAGDQRRIMTMGGASQELEKQFAQLQDENDLRNRIIKYSPSGMLLFDLDYIIIDKLMVSYHDLALAAKGYRYLIVKDYLVFYVVSGQSVQIRRILYGRRDYQALL